MSAPNEPAGHQGTPRHGLHDGAKDHDIEEEGAYVDSQLGDEEPADHHDDEEGTYVDSQLGDDESTEHHDPDAGSYVDADREDEPTPDD